MDRRYHRIEGTPYEYSELLSGPLSELADGVKAMRRSGPLSEDVLYRIRKYFRIKNIYHSNAIEGNLLNVGETRQVVELGMTITGKPLKDQAEAKNLSEAIDLLEELASDNSKPITESDVRQLHAFVLRGIDELNAGKYRGVPVEISGSDYKPELPEAIPVAMGEFGSWLSKVSVPDKRLTETEALLYAVAAHTWFVMIHPFTDGNGRVARLLMNLILMRYGFPIVIITREDRHRYYDALEEAQTSDLSPFLALVIEAAQESLEEYQEAAKEQEEIVQWADSVLRPLNEHDLAVARNEYELWKHAMDLFRSTMRKYIAVLNDSAADMRIFFKEFGMLELEKYLSLRKGGSAKKTWFFRIDFVHERRNRNARYLFFFGTPSHLLSGDCNVTLHLSREEPSGSFYYERLSTLRGLKKTDIPNLCEVGYDEKREKFLVVAGQHPMHSSVERLTRNFFNQVLEKQFSC